MSFGKLILTLVFSPPILPSYPYVFCPQENITPTASFFENVLKSFSSVYTMLPDRLDTGKRGGGAYFRVDLGVP